MSRFTFLLEYTICPNHLGDCYIGEKAGVEVSNFAKREFLSTASSSGGFLRSMDVAGSGLYQTVLAVGKFVGFDFKP